MKYEEIIVSKKGEEDPYEDAYESAPPEVRDAIERWREEVPDDEKSERPLLYWILGTGTPDYKMPKDMSQYTDKSEIEGQRCGNCEFAYFKLSNKKYICSQVRGKIRPAGWCKLWKPFKK